MKSFKKLRDFARQGGKSREKQVVASDGRSSSSHYHAGGYDGGYLEPTPDAELIVQGMQVGRGNDALWLFSVSIILRPLCFGKSERVACWWGCVGS